MHFEPWSKDGKGDVEGWVRRISSREGHFGFEQHLTLVTNLSRLPEGRDWLRSNTLYLPALERHADEAVPLLEGSESPGNPIRRLRRELALSP
jgi:hypothetical protein